MKHIPTAIIGFGLSGKVFHAPFIDVVEGLELSMISTSNPENREYIARHYPQTTIVSDAEAILSTPEIELVIVTSPNVYHFHWARKALLAGKHVVVEKPFTISAAEADTLIDTGKKQQKILTVYHNRRFTSDTKTVKKLLDSNILGDIVDYETHFDRFRPNPKIDAWRETNQPGAGIFYDLGSHLIDQALYFFGPPNAITAEIKRQRLWAKADDWFDVKLHYPSLTATLKSSTLAKIAGPTYQIHGTHGSFVKYGLDVQEEKLKNEQIPNTDVWGTEPKSIWGRLDTEYNGIKINGKIESERGDYRDYFINLRDAIWGKAEIAVKPEEARNVMHVIELAILSSKEKRTLAFGGNNR